VKFADVLNDLAVDFGLVEDRAGRYPRRLARERQKAVLRASWPRLLGVFLVGFAAVGLTVLLPRWTRDFVAGAWLATVVCALVFVVVLSSGTAPTMMGATAEQWTAQELRVLRRRGWRVLSHTMPTYGDIDHIAVGPGGLVVLETKWRSDPLALDDPESIRAECEQVRERTRLIRLALQSRLQGAPTRSVIVYWGPGRIVQSRLDPLEVSGVTVLVGPMLRDWLASINGDTSTAMDREAIDSAWQTLAKIAEDTDRRELGAEGPILRTPMRHLIDLVAGLAMGLIAFTTAVILFRWVGVLAVLPVVIALGGGALVALLTPLTNALLRVVGLGATVGYFAFLVLMAGVYAYVALVRT
jgi:hypothetical protein